MGRTNNNRPLVVLNQPAERINNQRGGRFRRRPSNDAEVLRIIPLGGCEEVGRNMTVFEYGQDIVILDMGIQFPEEDMPGIDYIIPNVKYLAGKEKKIRGVIFSHGHLDHVGAAPILLEKLGNPTIIGRDLTLAIIKHKQEDYQPKSAQYLKMIPIKNMQDPIRLGRFTVRFFQVEHSIMDAMGVILETPAGTVVHPGDWTLERDKNGRPTINYSHLQRVKKPSVLMLESLGSMNEKHSGSYEQMYKNLYEIISQAPGRVIIGTFSSQIERIKWVLQAAEKLGKKVALDGYSMRLNIEIAKELGYIKVRKGVLINIKEIDSQPDKKIVVICTGAQGEENAVLSRIVDKQHLIKLKKSDTVIFSSSVIPGNERTIQRLKDNIYRQADQVIHGDLMDVHVSGHATREDIVTVLKEIRPTYFIPVYANHFFLKEARNLAIKNGFPADKIIVPDNGSVIEVKGGQARTLNEKVPSEYVFVDGLGVTDSQNIVLRDRQVLAEDGMVVVIVTIGSKTGKLVQNPDIISRGFVFLKENKKLIEDLRHKVKKMVIESDPKTWADTNLIKNNIRDKVGQFLFSKTEKRPMILPVVIEV
ncbi:MAG TPA: ribonuclease J [Patescibacteria group bacterium]|nr:ribonuclease J [Patescibacteria group bacterium]